MMTDNEYLLVCLGEECDEVGQRVTKALRFGIDEIQPGQPLDNGDRIAGELRDLIAVATLLQGRRIIPRFTPSANEVAEKYDKIERYKNISRERGIVS